MYNKLFSKILDSSIWLEDMPTRIVWLTLLAAMDEDGFAHFSAVDNLALRSRVTLEQAQKAVGILSSPDANSCDPENDGKRVERVPGGYLVLNASKYRSLVSRTESLRLHRERTQRYRDKKRSAGVTLRDACDASVTLRDVCVTESKAGAEANTGSKNKKCATDVAQLAGFTEFWSAYPLHLDKKRAAVEWAKLKPSIELQATILKAIKTQACEREARRAGAQFTPEWKHPLTWLRGRCWEDEPLPIATSTAPARKLSAVELVRHTVEQRRAERERTIGI